MQVKELELVELLLADGVTKIEVNTDQHLRAIVYRDEIQLIRNEESFVDYHTKNPGTIAPLLKSGTSMLMQNESYIEHRFDKSKSNRSLTRPIYIAPERQVQQSMFYIGPVLERVPISALIQYTNQWFKGLLISIYGADAFDIIKKAEEEAKDEWLKNIKLEVMGLWNGQH